MTWLELTASLFALLGIYLNTQRRRSSWLFAIVSSFLFLFFFVQIRLYADAALQVFFVLSSAYGWNEWKRNKISHSELRVFTMPVKVLLIGVPAATLLGLSLGYFLQLFTDASYPLLDSLLFSFSVFATILSARAYLQNWYFWLLINAAYVFMYIGKTAYITAALYAILFVLAYIGLFQWKKIIEKEID